MKWGCECLLLTCCLLAACAPGEIRTTRTDAPWYQTLAESRQSDADRVLLFYERLRAMKVSELNRELETARQAFESDKSDLNRLGLALLLSYPGTSFRDDSMAIALLNPVVKDKVTGASTLRPLAILLQTELMEIRRAEESAQQQAAKLKDEQRRGEALQQKLDAILDMEMKMIEREQNAPKKK